MTQFDESTSPADKSRAAGIDRRTLVKSAAWSAPVIALAVATPFAAASTGNSSLSWTNSSTSLVTLNLLDGGGTVTATALTTLPTQATLQNGSGAISKTATVTITVGRPAGINITVGRARGFGVYSYNGVTSTAGQRTAVYQTLAGVRYGFPATTFVTTQSVTVASNGSVVIPVVFGLAGSSTGVAVSALATFPVTLQIDFGGGQSYSANSTISVPVGAGIL